MYTSYLRALELRSTRIRKQHLVPTKLFDCQCKVCTDPDCFRRMPCPHCVQRVSGSLQSEHWHLRRAGSPEGYLAHAAVTPLDTNAEEWVCEECEGMFDTNEVFPLLGETIDWLGHKRLRSFAEIEEVAENVVDRLDEQIADRSVPEESGNIKAANLLDTISPYLGTQHWAVILLRDRCLCYWFDACAAADSDDAESVLESVRMHHLCVRDEVELSKELFHEFCMLHKWYDSVGACATWGLASEAASVARVIGLPHSIHRQVISILKQHAARGECEYGNKHEAVLALHNDIAALDVYA